MFVLVAASVTIASCSKVSDVAPTDDNEAITTATLQLTNASSATDIVTATVENLNTSAVFTNATLRLKPNTTYNAKVLLFDKTKTPVTDVSAEIVKEVNEHLFIYTPASTLKLTVTITDKDTNPAPGPYPVGLSSTFVTGAASTGKLQVVLRHQPNAKNGTATPGTTDLDTNFDVIIQ